MFAKWDQSVGFYEIGNLFLFMFFYDCDVVSSVCSLLLTVPVKNELIILVTEYVSIKDRNTYIFLYFYDIKISRRF